MENVKNVETMEQQAQTVQAPSQEEPARTFSQEDVNRIVQERLARERERINSMINEDESIRKELQASRLKLKAAAKLSEKGYPHILLELADFSSEESMAESMEKIGKLYDAAYLDAVNAIYKQNGRQPGKGSGNQISSADALRDAFRLKKPR